LKKRLFLVVGHQKIGTGDLGITAPATALRAGSFATLIDNNSDISSLFSVIRK
jgi:hypothetical protein